MVYLHGGEILLDYCVGRAFFQDVDIVFCFICLMGGVSLTEHYKSLPFVFEGTG